MSEIDWLQINRYYSDLDENKLKSIFYFSIIWNIYEKELCKTHGSIGSHPKKHSNDYCNTVDQEHLNSVFAYFKKRYISNGEPSNHYVTFEFNSEPIKAEVFELLSGENPTNKHKLKALLCIAFRLRNNLFHGLKQVDKLYAQNENFRQINLLLMNLIDLKL